MEKFTPREWQDALISTVSKNLEEKNKVAIEAPTGSGKTSFVLYLAFITGKKLIYLTRTHNEFTRLYEDNQKYFNLPVLYMFGKSKLCPLKERWYESEDDGQKNVCKGCPLKEKTIKLDLKNIHSPEIFLQDMEEDSTDKIRKDVNSRALARDTKGELVAIDKDKMVSYCPYYSARSSMPEAQVIAMTYNYLLNPSIRFNVFHGTEGEEMLDLNDSYIIFDEAHNLDSVIENFGRNLSIKTVEKALDSLVKEFPLDKYNNYERVEANLILEKLLTNMSSTKPTNDLKEFKFSNDFISKMENLESINTFSEEFEERNEKRAVKKRTRNYLENVYNFLYDYQRIENGNIYSFASNTEKKDLKLKLMYYDTSNYFSFLKGSGVIFMSGTMPSEDHISKVWNMDDVLYLRVDSIFKNAGGIKNYNAVRGYTTLGRYRQNIEEWANMLKKYMEFSLNVYSKSEKSVLVAVPSYKILFGDDYTKVPGIASFLPDSMRSKCVFENKRISYSTIERMANEDKIMIFSVHGGKLLEGIQLVSHGESLISDVIIAGLPLTPLDDYRKDKIKYLERILNKNAYNLLYYEYALIKVKQAAGRSTRSPEDHASIWLCDDRFQEPFWQHNLLSNEK
ncbi:ATP-dependent DNA helicase [Ferroplasma sp.]|uniref:ATP-dependent DNA helicase n=1 Tax=Ferroplasma sp. TaxID=2591003 RepID=UPI00307EC648